MMQEGKVISNASLQLKEHEAKEPTHDLKLAAIGLKSKGYDMINIKPNILLTKIFIEQISNNSETESQARWCIDSKFYGNIKLTRSDSCLAKIQ